MRVIVLVVLLCVTLGACGSNNGSTGGCSSQDRAAIVRLADSGAWVQFMDAEKVAQASSRIAMGQPVADLQRIRRDFTAEAWPACAATAKQAILDGMNATIDGFLAFMGNEPDATVQAHLSDSTAAWQRATDAITRLRPTPTP